MTSVVLVLSLAACAGGGAPSAPERAQASSRPDQGTASDAAVARLRKKAPSLDRFTDRQLRGYSTAICSDLRRRANPYPILDQLQQETDLSAFAVRALIVHAAYNYCPPYADLMDNAFG